MENFNDTINKFEEGFDALAKNSTEFNLTLTDTEREPPQYVQFDYANSFASQKPLKPPRPLARKSLSTPRPKYVNIGCGNEKPLKSHLDRSTRKKKSKKSRARPCELLPRINENLCENFSQLALSDREPGTIQPEAIEPTGYFLSDTTPSETILHQNEPNLPEDYAEFVLQNNLYIDFLRRIGESPTEYFSLGADNTLSPQKPLTQNEPNSSVDYAELLLHNTLCVDFLRKTGESPTEYFSLGADNTLISQKLLSKSETLPRAKKKLCVNFAEPEKSTLDSFSNKKLRQFKKNQPESLFPLEEKKEPLIAHRNSDSTIEWGDQPNDTSQSDSIKSKQPHGLNFSKYLPKNLSFWPHSPEKKEQNLEEEKPQATQLRK